SKICSFCWEGCFTVDFYSASLPSPCGLVADTMWFTHSKNCKLDFLIWLLYPSIVKLQPLWSKLQNNKFLSLVSRLSTFWHLTREEERLVFLVVLVLGKTVLIMELINNVAKVH
ncbi:Unknown protein, partial [Striga hermonthica]